MGDTRFERPYRALLRAPDRAAAIRALADEDVIAALTVAREEKDPYLANILASEAMNRVRRKGLIVETANEGLLSQDAAGRLTYMNPAAERMLGWTTADLVGRPVHATLHFQHEDGSPLGEDDCAAMRVARTGESVRGVLTTLTRKDGTTFPAEQNVAPIVREGEIEGVVVTFTDVTERRRAEAAVRQLASIVESSRDAIVMYTPEGKLLTWNQGAEKMYGWSAAEIIGRSVLDLYAPEEKHRFRELMQAAARGEPVRAVEMRRVRKDGEAVDVSVTVSPILDAAGRTIALSGVSQDITERRRAEAALRESEARKRAMLAASLDATITIDSDSRIHEWNPAAERIFGWSEQEALGRDLAELIIPPEYQEAHRRGLSRYLSTGEGPVLGRRIELPARRRDGSIFPTEISILPIKMPGRALFTGFLRDISERKRWEEALRASEERFRALYDHSPLIYVIVDRAGKVVSANEFGLHYLGYTHEDVVGQDVTTLYHPADKEEAGLRLRQFFERPPAPMETYQWEGRKLAKDGTVVWVREYLSRLPGPAEANVALVACFDVTDARRAAQALEQSRRQAASILESITDAFFAIDREWRVTYANRHALPILQRAMSAPTDLIGRPLLEAIPRARGTTFEHNYRRVLEERVSIEFEEYFAPLAVWFEVHAYPSEGGGASIFFRDVTARKEAQEALRHLAEQLERRVQERTRSLELALQDLETFTNSASHDLRAPLRGIGALLEAAQEDLASGHPQEAAETVRRALVENERAQRLVRDLLAFARASGASLAPTRVDVTRVAEEIVREIEAKRPEWRVAWSIQPGMSALADEGLLRAALFNLMDNASKYASRQERPSVEVTARAEGGRVSIAVADNGIGFTMVEATRLFAPFTRLPGASGFEGTGLGLASVRRIAERHGGRAYATGVPGRGATFVLELPENAESPEEVKRNA